MLRLVSSTNSELFSKPARTISALRCPPSRTAKLFRASMKPCRSPSTPASSASYIDLIRHAEFIVSEINIGDLVSAICSPAGWVVRISRYGVTSLDKNASIVDIGASSRLLSNISTSPGIKRCKSAFMLLNRFLILLRNSDAAFLVKVIATTSLGRRPLHSTSLVLSRAGDLSAPCPWIGTLGPFGSNCLAR